MKSKYNIKKNGASPLLDRQLKEEWWRSCQNPKTIFDAFLTDMKKYVYETIHMTLRSGMKMKMKII